MAPMRWGGWRLVSSARSGGSSFAAPTPATAQFYQLYGSSGSSASDSSESGDKYAFNPTFKVGAGNRAVLAVSYPHGTAPTITATNGNTFSASPLITATNAGGCDLSLWELKNATAGTMQVAIAFGAAVGQVWWDYAEFSGLSISAANSGVQGSGASPVTGPNLSCGAFTPTNNDANGGNLILAFFFDANTGGNAGPTGFVAQASPGFELLEANHISNATLQHGLVNASEFFVQLAFASITPTMTATGDTTGAYNCVAIALPLSSGAGTPPPASDIYIAKSIKQCCGDQNGATTIPCQFPTVGNTRVFMSSRGNNGAGNGEVTSVTDNEGNTWTDETQTNDTPAIYVFKNAAPNPNLVVTLHMSSGGAGQNMDGWFIDIANGATGTLIGAVGHAAPGTFGPGSTGHLPDITPTSTTSLILACVSNGLGPTGTSTTSSNLSAPSGAISNNILITTAGVLSEQDGGTTNSGDAFGYIYNASLSAQSWTWNLANAATCQAVAIEFLKA